MGHRCCQPTGAREDQPLLLRGLSDSGENRLKHVPADLLPFPGPHGESTPAKGNRGQEKTLSLAGHSKEAQTRNPREEKIGRFADLQALPLGHGRPSETGSHPRETPPLSSRKPQEPHLFRRHSLHSPGGLPHVQRSGRTDVRTQQRAFNLLHAEMNDIA